MGNPAQNEDSEATSPSIADTIASRSRAEARASELVGGLGGRDRCVSCLAIEVILAISDHLPLNDRGTLR